jgi:hypothetical protein
MKIWGNDSKLVKLTPGFPTEGNLFKAKRLMGFLWGNWL